MVSLITQTGYSFGYGFVNYYRLKDAMKARYIMNGKPVKHKYIKVSFARPPSEDIKDTNLFLTGLPEFVTELELEDMFCPYGVVVHRKVLRDYETGLPRGIGFVRYETKMEAAAAIENLNGKIPSGASGPIKVRLAQDQGKQKAVYLAGYEAAMEEQDIDPAEDLSTNTRPVGVPVLNPSGRAKTGRRKKSSKGAKVLYEHSNAHEGSHGSVRGGHNEGLIGNYRGGKIKGPPEGPFGSGPYRGRIPESGSSSDQNSNRKEGYSAENTNLYVCGLPDFVDEEELVSMFARFGLIVNRYILRDKRNLRPKGAGFVRFKTESEANAAIVAMNNTRPNGFPKLMTVKLAHDQSPKYYQNYQEEGCQGSWGNAGPNPYDDYSAPPWNAPIWDDDWSRDPRSAPDRPSSALPYAAAYSLRDVTTPRYDMRPHTTLPVVRPDADEPPEGPHGSRPGIVSSVQTKFSCKWQCSYNVDMYFLDLQLGREGCSEVSTESQYVGNLELEHQCRVRILLYSGEVTIMEALSHHADLIP